MDALDLGRWQFGIVTVCHFLFVLITTGLSAVVARCGRVVGRRGVRDDGGQAVVWITHEPIGLDRIDAVVQLDRPGRDVRTA